MSRAKVRKDGVQRDAVTAGIFWLVPQVRDGSAARAAVG